MNHYHQANDHQSASTSSPLRWPVGWPRTEMAERIDGSARFSTENGPVSFLSAREKLEHELRLLRAQHIVISWNRREREGSYDSGYSGRDPGVAVYFFLNDRQRVIACDRFRSSADNLRSIGLAIAAMRQLERHGSGALMDRAFAGFVALPPPKSCWEVLGVTDGASPEINRAYRARAKEAHPDNGGSNSDMAELNRARDEALRSLPQPGG